MFPSTDFQRATNLLVAAFKEKMPRTELRARFRKAKERALSNREMRILKMKLSETVKVRGIPIVKSFN